MLSFLEYIFPKKCVGCGKFGEYFCDDCQKKIENIDKPICPVCFRQAIGGKTHPRCKTKYSLDGLIFATKYQGIVKRAISKVKYKWAYDIENEFVNILAKEIWQFDIPQKAILVPVPLHKKRENWRGFNQAIKLAENISKKFKVPSKDILVRNRETKTQVGLDKNERKKNMKGAFSLNEKYILKRKSLDFARDKIITPIGGRNVIILDDVFTSGATMNECAKVLKKAEAKSIWGMVLAHG